jgi:dolichol-phosphate mannosyltransferase
MYKKINIPISCIVPVYNEEEVLPGFLEKLENELKRNFSTFEIVLVDDGSADSTPKFIKNISKKAVYKAIGFKKNMGQSAAIHYGVMNAKHPVVVTLDADGQNDPSDIAHLVMKLKDNTVVCGYRLKRQDYFFRKFFSLTARKLLNLAGGVKVDDPGCTLKVFYRDDFVRLPFFNGMHRFIPYLFYNNGVKLIQVEVHHKQRQGGKSKYKLWSRTFRVAFDISGLFWLRKRMLPYHKYLK